MKKKSSDYYYLADYKGAEELPPSRSNLPYIIASSAFRGNHKNARRLYKDNRKLFDQAETIFISFHLGVSFTRTSNYSEAKQFFINNWKKRKDPTLSGIERFFIYQGLSFFRFFFSKHESSLYFADLAENELLKEESAPPLLITLVNDLIAHNLFQLGRPAKAELFLKKAIQTSKINSLLTLEKEFQASLAIYKSQYSTDVDTNIISLKKLLKKTPLSNDYTSSELVLQISKLYLIKGSYADASNFLVKNFSVIYENDNKRKVAKLNTLLAQLLLPKGQYIEALSLLNVAKTNLREDVDFNLMAPILGIESKVLSLLNQDTTKQDAALITLLTKTDKGILRQIDSRFTTSPRLNEEDQLGVLFDRAALKDEASLETIIENKLFHLAVLYYGPFQSKKTMALHPKNIGLFFFSEEESTFIKMKVSKNQYRFLTLLALQPRTKEELIREIWGYSDYDPLRHDHLVYTLVRRIRSSFGEKKSWIQSSEDLYFFDGDIQFISNSKAQIRKSIASDTHENIMTIEKDINFRQIKILEGVLEDGFSANDVAEVFNVTRMTAYRDLNELLAKQFLVKIGKSRGTRYFIN